MFGLGPFEIVIIGAIAVMLYGKRLPEVGRSVGQSLGELRRQWNTLSREFDVASHVNGRLPPAKRSPRRADEAGPMVEAPRFEPPPAIDGEA